MKFASDWSPRPERKGLLRGTSWVPRFAELERVRLVGVQLGVRLGHPHWDVLRVDAARVRVGDRLHYGDFLTVNGEHLAPVLADEIIHLDDVPLTQRVDNHR